MKFLFVFLMFICSSVFAQEQVKVAKVANPKQFSKESGVYKFTLAFGITKDEIQKKASSYTRFFVTDFNEKDNSISISMIENSSENRKIIKRLFISLGIDEIIFNDKTFSVAEFYEGFLM